MSTETTEELLSRMEREHVQRPCCESPACPWPSVCNRCLVDWPCETARLVAHARSLAAALREFGDHKDTCNYYMAWHDNKRQCDCGLAAALGEAQ